MQQKAVKAAGVLFKSEPDPGGNPEKVAKGVLID